MYSFAFVNLCVVFWFEFVFMVFVKTRRLFKYMHSQWTRIHCSDGRWRETPKALYYNHLPAAYLTFASPSVFVFLFVLKPAFEFLICNFNFNTISSLFFCIWVGLLFTFEVVLQPFVQFVSHLHPIWFDFNFYFNYLPVAAYLETIQIMPRDSFRGIVSSEWKQERNKRNTF